MRRRCRTGARHRPERHRDETKETIDRLNTYPVIDTTHVRMAPFCTCGRHYLCTRRWRCDAPVVAPRDLSLGHPYFGRVMFVANWKPERRRPDPTARSPCGWPYANGRLEVSGLKATGVRMSAIRCRYFLPAPGRVTLNGPEAARVRGWLVMTVMP